MGLLVNSKTKQRIYLKSIHSMGRDAESCDTALYCPLCSRLQCVIRYQNSAWYLYDESRNGTYLNGAKLSSGGIRLKEGDNISFPGDQDNNWTLEDISSPSSVLLFNGGEQYIELEKCNALPNERHPELLITKEEDSLHWFIEQGELVKPLRGGDRLYLSGQPWVFYPNDMVLETQAYQIQDSKDELHLFFGVSLNEENVQLVTSCRKIEKDMGYKVHHQLLVILARRLISDVNSGFPLRDSGWIATDLLLRELRIEAAYLNILIYRSRTAFERAGIKHPPIDRRQGELRLRPCRVSIQKGEELVEHSPDIDGVVASPMCSGFV
ncbi:FHA domain-containing protein [Microbulbifer sp. TRSA001]|uniref:FHA domain-containing protein n=1 Tax=Microbulbifer sp. TRSA001 TaxID=3243381 RepID=UPI004039E662